MTYFGEMGQSDRLFVTVLQLTVRMTTMVDA